MSPISADQNSISAFSSSSSISAKDKRFPSQIRIRGEANSDNRKKSDVEELKAEHDANPTA